MKKIPLIAMLLLGAICGPLQAENMIMARVQMDFIAGQEKLGGLLQEYGYQVAHVQKCDGGLKGFGYSSDL